MPYGFYLGIWMAFVYMLVVTLLAHFAVRRFDSMSSLMYWTVFVNTIIVAVIPFIAMLHYLIVH